MVPDLAGARPVMRDVLSLQVQFEDFDMAKAVIHSDPKILRGKPVVAMSPSSGLRRSGCKPVADSMLLSCDESSDLSKRMRIH
jgi:hypothetical protein